MNSNLPEEKHNYAVVQVIDAKAVGPSVDLDFDKTFHCTIRGECGPPAKTKKDKVSEVPGHTPELMGIVAEQEKWHSTTTELYPLKFTLSYVPQAIHTSNNSSKNHFL